VIAVATILAEGLADAARLQERWRFAAARDALTAVLADPAAPTGGLAMVTGRRMLAEVLRELGEVDEAYAVAQPLAAECERRFGGGHPATARALTVLATAVHARGDLADARDLYERVLDGRFREAGPAGRAVRAVRAHLALLDRDAAVDSDGTSRARAALDAAYKGLRRAYGVADPDTIRFGVELAGMCRRAGDDRAARRLLTVARAGCQARLEPWHPLTALVRRELTEVERVLPGAAREPLAPAERGRAGEVTGARPPAPHQATVPAPRPPVADAGDGLPVRVEAEGRLPTEAGRRLPIEVNAPGRPRWRRPVLFLIVAALAVTAVAVAAVVAAAVVAGTPAGQRPVAHPTPTVGHQPLRVELRDDGTRLLASWLDPADGPAPVVVAVARDGKPAAVAATLPAGTREYALTDLDPQADYCVIVAAVYPGETAAGATSVCTHRAPPSRVAGPRLRA
jgi:hypothetical protein